MPCLKRFHNRQHVAANGVAYLDSLNVPFNRSKWDNQNPNLAIADNKIEFTLPELATNLFFWANRGCAPLAAIITLGAPEPREFFAN